MVNALEDAFSLPSKLELAMAKYCGCSMFINPVKERIRRNLVGN